ncbi:MAG: hypothetical protein R3B09_02375 [Nannocystaceae bacterium]
MTDLNLPGRVVSDLRRRGIVLVGDVLSLPKDALIRHGLRAHIGPLTIVADALEIDLGRVPGWEQLRPLARAIGPLVSEHRAEGVDLSSQPAQSGARPPRSHHFRLSADVEARLKELGSAHRCSLTHVVCAVIVTAYDSFREGRADLTSPTYTLPPSGLRESSRSHHFRLPADVADRLKDLAAAQGSTQTSVLACAIIAESNRYRHRDRASPKGALEVPEEMVSVTTACSILGVSWSVLHRLVDEGRLVGERVGKRLQLAQARVAELAEELARERSLEDARAGEWETVKKGERSLLRPKTRAALSRSGIRREEALAVPLDQLRRLPGVGSETVADVLHWRRRTGGEQPTALSARPCFTREEKISVVRSLAASPVETLDRVRERTGLDPQEVLALLQQPVVHLTEIGRRSGASLSTLLDFWEHPGRTTMETVAGVALAVEQERALVDMVSGARRGAEPLGGPATGLVSPATPDEPPVSGHLADAPPSASDEPELSVDELSGLLKLSASVVFTQAGSFPGARWDGQTWRFQRGPLLAALGLPPDERPDLIGRRVALEILGRCSLETLLGRQEFWGRKIVGRWRYDRRGVLAYARRAGKLTSDEVAKWLLV